MSTPWTEEEKAIIRDIWSNAKPLKDELHRLPGRKFSAIKAAAIRFKLGRKPRNFSPMWPKIDALMKDGVLRSSFEIAAILKRDEQAVREYLIRATENGSYHYPVIRRAQTNGRQQRVYKFGPGKNADPLPMLTAKERVERCLAKIDPEELHVRRDRYYTRRLIKTKRIVKRDPLTAALFGEAA